jgi:uncharacterized membrane protein
MSSEALSRSEPAKAGSRIQSIDLVRGAVMVLMLLDHSRNFWTEGNGVDPVNLSQTFPLLFFTRWITHFCAPLFVLLTGVSAYLTKTSRNQTPGRAAVNLGVRGLWLIVLELTVVSALWQLVFFLNGIQLQVIWAIGISLVFLAFLQFLPSRWVGLIGLALIALHNLIPDLPQANTVEQFLWSLFHQSGFFTVGNYVIVALYPAVPWVGVMALGYALGEFFTRGSASRRKTLFALGLFFFVLFLVLRFLNVYGDPVPFKNQKDLVFNVMAFINLQKYPPSLLFLLVTLGPGLMVLAGIDRVKVREKNFLLIFGRTPLFFYLVHLFLLNVSVALELLVQKLLFAGKGSLQMQLAFPLWTAYVVWIALLPLLYRFCTAYWKFKFQGKKRWWTYYV